MTTKMEERKRKWKRRRMGEEKTIPWAIWYMLPKVFFDYFGIKI